MSLINDALKRASASMKKQPPALPGAPLEPAPDEPKSGKGAFLLVLALLVLAGAGYGLWAVFKPQPTEVAAKSAAATPKASDNQPAEAPHAKPQPAEGSLADSLSKAADTAVALQKQNQEGAQATEQINNPPNTEGPKTHPAEPTVAAQAAPQKFPELSLQGIYYRLNRPSARISGKTLYVGDQYEGATIKSIQRRSVTVEFAGQTKELALPGN